MKHFAILSSILILASCATEPTPYSRQRPVPSSQVFVKSPPPSQDTAKVVVVRDTGALLAIHFIHFYIDDQRVASLNPGERLEVNVPVGEHIFGVKPTDPFGLHAGFNIDQTLKAGRTYYYRLLIDNNSGPRIQREQAEARD